MKNAPSIIETNAKGIKRQSVVSEIILCVLCGLILSYRARNSHIW